MFGFTPNWCNNSACQHHKAPNDPERALLDVLPQDGALFYAANWRIIPSTAQTISTGLSGRRSGAMALDRTRAPNATVRRLHRSSERISELPCCLPVAFTRHAPAVLSLSITLPAHPLAYIGARVWMLQSRAALSALSAGACVLAPVQLLQLAFSGCSFRRHQVITAPAQHMLTAAILAGQSFHSVADSLNCRYADADRSRELAYLSQRVRNRLATC